MSLRSYSVVFLSSVVLLIFGSNVLAQNDQKMQTTQSPAVIPPGVTLDAVTGLPPVEDPEVRVNIVARLNLKKFEDVGDATCEVGKKCSNIARYKSVLNTCGPSGSKDPTKYFEKESGGDEKLLDELICQVVVFPTVQNRDAFVDAVKGHAADYVNGLALMQALKGNSESCQKVVKEFLGPYGKNWDVEWLAVMSGCRILSKDRTVKEEEDDYLIWHNVATKTVSCDEIKNIEMRAACSAGVEAP